MITLDKIQELREKTGLGLMDCKKALTETNGDIEKAIDLLRKKGSLVAEKRSGNKTSAGLVHAYIHAGSQVGVLIEVCCETDFVARTDTIKEFANNVALHIAAMKPLALSSDEISPAVIEKEKSIFKEQLAQTNKPAAVIESILEGKLKKFFAENCLMDQMFIKNDKMSINEYLKEVIAKVGENVRIRRFVRYEIGL